MDLSGHNGLIGRADGGDLKGYIFDTENLIEDWSFEIFNLHNEIYPLTGPCMVINLVAPLSTPLTLLNI